MVGLLAGKRRHGAASQNTKLSGRSHELERHASRYHQPAEPIPVGVFRLRLNRKQTTGASAWIKTSNVDSTNYGAQINLHELQLRAKSDSLKGDNGWTRISVEFKQR